MTTLKLRYYQLEAVEAFYNHLKNRDDNPCIVIPTGGGKSAVVSQICKDFVAYGGKVLVLSHVKELLEQLHEHLAMQLPSNKIGLYSAGLGSRDTSQDVLICGIQSVYKRAHELNKPDIILIDEAHLIPEDGDGMYQTFYKAMEEINPDVRIGGLTATPYRMKTGHICQENTILNKVCYEIGIKELIKKGYLCNIISKNAVAKVDDSELHILGGEFKFDEMEALYSVEETIDKSVGEILEYTKDRNKVLIFGSGLDHCRKLSERIEGSKCVFGETQNRDVIIDEFKNGDLKYLINNAVLTTGFDARNIDCVAMVRSTMSPGLYSQIVGRGLRTHESKENCLLLDFGNNIQRHGPIDDIYIPERRIGRGGQAPVKECQNCHSMVHLSVRKCPDCGEEFPVNEKPKHSSTASSKSALSEEAVIEEHEVENTFYEVNEKEKDGKISRTMRVDYEIGWRLFKREWVCFEHQGYARAKAEGWWALHAKDPKSKIPSDVEEAVKRCENGEVKKVVKIETLKEGAKGFERIRRCWFAEDIKDDFIDFKSSEEDEDDDTMPF